MDVLLLCWFQKERDIRTKGTHRRRSEEYPLYSNNDYDDDDDDIQRQFMWVKKMGERGREGEREIYIYIKKKKKERRKTGQPPFQSTVSKRLLCRFVCGCFESTEKKKKKKRKKLLLLLQLLVNWIEWIEWMPLSTSSTIRVQAHTIHRHTKRVRRRMAWWIFHRRQSKSNDDHQAMLIF